MENEDLQDQVKHAVQMLFYGSPGSNEQQQADQWLSVFQTKEEAWKVALDLISSQTTEEVKFVASQILIFKVKMQGLYLSAEDRAEISNTCFNYLQLGNQRITLELWESRLTIVLASLCASSLILGQSEILDRLNESIIDSETQLIRIGELALFLKIMTEFPGQLSVIYQQQVMENTSSRFQVWDVVQQHIFPSVLQVCAQALSLLEHEFETQMQIISANCLTQWCNLNEWSDGTQVGLNLNNFINSGLLSVFVEVLRSNQHEECCKAISDLLDSLLQAPSPIKDPPKSLLDFVAILFRCFERVKAEPNDEIVLSMVVPLVTLDNCKIIMISIINLENLVENHFSAIINAEMSRQTDNSHTCGLLQLLLHCSSHTNMMIASLPLNFWYTFGDCMQEINCPELLLNYLGDLLDILLQKCMYPQNYQGWDTDDSGIDPEAFVSYREQAHNTILGLASTFETLSLLPNPVMLHLHDSIVQSSHSMEAVNSEFDWANQWNQIESSLYLWGGVLEALDVEGDDCDSTEEDDETCARVQSQTKKEKQIQERDESTQMIINVVTFSAITIDGCTRQENITLAQTGLALISNSNPWIKKCSDILPMVVQSVVNALLCDPLSTIAAKTMRRICISCNKAIMKDELKFAIGDTNIDLSTVLLQILSRNIESTTVISALRESVVLLSKWLPQDQRCTCLFETLSPIMQDIHSFIENSVNSALVTSHLQILRSCIRSISPHSTATQISMELWPIIHSLCHIYIRHPSITLCIVQLAKQVLYSGSSKSGVLVGPIVNTIVMIARHAFEIGIDNSDAILKEIYETMTLILSYFGEQHIFLGHFTGVLSELCHPIIEQLFSTIPQPKESSQLSIPPDAIAGSLSLLTSSLNYSPIELINIPETPYASKPLLTSGLELSALLLDCQVQESRVLKSATTFLLRGISFIVSFQHLSHNSPESQLIGNYCSESIKELPELVSRIVSTLMIGISYALPATSTKIAAEALFYLVIQNESDELRCIALSTLFQSLGITWTQDGADEIFADAVQDASESPIYLLPIDTRIKFAQSVLEIYSKWTDTEKFSLTQLRKEFTLIMQDLKIVVTTLSAFQA